jgi:hypothetical protein
LDSDLRSEIYAELRLLRYRKSPDFVHRSTSAAKKRTISTTWVAAKEAEDSDKVKALVEQEFLTVTQNYLKNIPHVLKIALQAAPWGPLINLDLKPKPTSKSK